MIGIFNIEVYKPCEKFDNYHTTNGCLWGWWPQVCDKLTF
jgi:hypothetical protein